MGRKAANENDALQSLPEGHKDQAGRYGSNSRQGVYAPALPLTAMLALAGQRQELSSYFLIRDVLQPSDSLKQKVFPTWASLEELRNATETDIAAHGFLELMECLSASFLQDTVVFRTMVRKYFEYFLFIVLIVVIFKKGGI